MLEITLLINKRVSCRTYAANKPIEKNIWTKLNDLVEAEHKGPFGHKPQFHLLNQDMSSPAEWRNLGTYGVIKNARFFLAGKVQKGKKVLEDYGYCMEILILQATALGLGTCWLAGTFQASGFAQAINLQKNEILPAVSPLGYPAAGRSLTEKIFRFAAGSDRRKPWAEIFFADDLATPLTQAKAGKYSAALENLRLAPSASNKQPWRILFDSRTDTFHFYLDRSHFYQIREISIQDIDMGIAMSHFELTVREMGLSGGWKIVPDPPAGNSVDYIVSWQESGWTEASPR